MEQIKKMCVAKLIWRHAVTHQLAAEREINSMEQKFSKFTPHVPNKLLSKADIKKSISTIAFHSKFVAAKVAILFKSHFGLVE